MRFALPALVLAGLLSAPALAAEPFSIVALPDTQNYSESYPGTFTAQTQWIKDNLGTYNVQYVVHLGDIVQHGPDANEWARAKASMSILDGHVPYGTCMGNHDNHYDSGDFQYPPHYYVPEWEHTEDPNGEHYLANFGPSFYAGKDWYGGASDSGLSNYQLINAGGKEWLFLNLSIDTPASEVSWAHDVLTTHRDKPAMISTHRYMYDYRLFAGRYGEQLGGMWAGFDGAEEDYDPNGITSQQLYEDLISEHPNVYMVQCGHHHSEWRREDGNNSAGLGIVEILTDYQDSLNGGNGWLRIYTYDTDANTIDVRTYSPTLGRDRSPLDSYFETMLMVPEYAPLLQGRFGWSQEQFDAMLAQLYADVDGNNFDITLYPGYDDVLADYEAALRYRFDGNVPVMEGLFAAAFLSGERDPSFTLDVAFDSYIPEPATLSVVALGAIALAGRRRRRQA
jgi:hypothetical protein